MAILRIRKNTCSCCGHDIKRWQGYPYTDNEGNLCRACHINALRKWAGEIEIGKQLIAACLSPTNLAIWNLKNSQEKKLIYFRYLEKGLINYTIGPKLTNKI